MLTVILAQNDWEYILELIQQHPSVEIKKRGLEMILPQLQNPQNSTNK